MSQAPLWCVECTGSPFVLEVVNPANKMSLHCGNATKCVPVGQTVWANVNLAGFACFIPPEAIIPTVTGVYVIVSQFYSHFNS